MKFKHLSEIRYHPEFVLEWDVFRDSAWNPVTVNCNYGRLAAGALTLTVQQREAVNHAKMIWIKVCMSTGSRQAHGIADNVKMDWTAGNVAKSRLLHRMIHLGLPPTRTLPPHEGGGPAPWLLPGGDPFVVGEYDDYEIP